MAVAFHNKIQSLQFPLEVLYSVDTTPDFALEKIVRDIKIIVKNCLTSNDDITQTVNSNLSSIFDFRMSAMQELQKHNFVVGNFTELIEDRFKVFKSDPHLSVLFENVLFAIRTNSRVLNSFSQPNKSFSSNVELNSSIFKDIPKISYNGYLNLISTSAPDFLFPLFIDYLNYSLYIEFGLIAAFIINEEKLQIRPERIAQLAAFIANSTHEFGAIAREINPNKKTKKSAYLEEIPVNFLKEQNLIAEQGIAEFLENI